MDGWITVGTKIETKEFDKELRRLENALNSLQSDYDNMELNPYKTTESLQKISNKLDEVKKKYKEVKDEKEKAFGVKVVSSKKASDDLISAAYSNIAPQTSQNLKLDMEEINKYIKNANKGLTKTIGKVGKWALAIYGIRSAYLGIRQAISYVSQYNEDMANKIETIKYSLATGLEPVLVKLVNLAYTLTQYIGYLAKAWFNVDIFAKRSAKSTTAAAKASKSMAGFDTANKLNDSSGASGSGGINALQPLEDGEVPTWLKWIKDNGSLVASLLAGIAVGLTAVKLGVNLLTATGLAMFFTGATYAIINLIKFLKDPEFKTFTNIIIGIGVAVAGVAIMFAAWPVAIGAALIAVVALVVKYYDEIKSVFDTFMSYIEDNFFNKIIEKFGLLGELILAPIQFALGVLKGNFESFYGGLKKIVDGIVLLFKGNFTDGMKQIFGGLKDIMLAPVNAFISGLNQVIKGLNKIKIPDWVPQFGGKGINIPTIPKLAVGGIVNNPGRGVPIGGAIAGEAGREGVLPLTDSNTMAQLGQEIGKWISVNVDLTTKLDSRVLSRSLEKVQSNNSFARNGV